MPAWAMSLLVFQTVSAGRQVPYSKMLSNVLADRRKRKFGGQSFIVQW